MQPDSSPDALSPPLHIAEDLGLMRFSRRPQPLSKAQATFKRLTRRLDRLRRDIQSLSEKLSRDMELYSREIRPLEREVAEATKTVVRLVFPFWKDPAQGGQNDSEQIAEFLRHHFQRIQHILGDLEEPDLRTWARQLDALQPAPPHLEDFQGVPQDGTEELDAAGVNLDPGRSESDPQAGTAKWRQRFRSGQAPREHPGPRIDSTQSHRLLQEPTAQQLAEERRRRDVGSLYRQLAKILHPDLEPDPERRTAKEGAMKELTAAYKRNDLHALLQLELSWIAREEPEIPHLTDAKLAVYNAVLREQVEDLEREKLCVPMQPRFRPLAHFFNPLLGGIRFSGAAERRGLQCLLRSLRKSIDSLQGPRARHELNTLLAQFARAKRPPSLWLTS